mgnify:FL=1
MKKLIKQFVEDQERKISVLNAFIDKKVEEHIEEGYSQKEAKGVVLVTFRKKRTERDTRIEIINELKKIINQ